MYKIWTAHDFIAKMTLFNKCSRDVHARSQSEFFFGTSENFKGHWFHAGGDLKKEKVFYKESHHFLQALWWFPKKDLQFEKQLFSATFVYQIKNYTNLFGGGN